ncbi:MAG TPA: PP2C family protein-serine/threonine phosphatase [Candidatus Binatia bacterium]|nr:PP2C family protein-serine/threonine phosphatase [Candidatus Binatia bacterium]
MSESEKKLDYTNWQAPQEQSLDSTRETNKEKLQFVVGVESVASEKHPERNEDRAFGLPEHGVFGVFDGMGGYSGGERAAGLASEIIKREMKEWFIEPDSERSSPYHVGHAMYDAMILADRKIREESNSNSEVADMGTTGSLVTIIETEKNGAMKAVIVNIGDSRVYILRKYILKQVTLDDSPIYKDVEDARSLQAKFSEVRDPQKELLPAEQSLWNRRNQISQALGAGHLDSGIIAIDVLPGDKILLCSDGISDNLTDSQIQRQLTQNKHNQEAARDLVKAALEASRSRLPRSKPDDMTAMVIASIKQ